VIANLRLREDRPEVFSRPVQRAKEPLAGPGFSARPFEGREPGRRIRRDEEPFQRARDDRAAQGPWVRRLYLRGRSAGTSSAQSPTACTEARGDRFASASGSRRGRRPGSSDGRGGGAGSTAGSAAASRPETNTLADACRELCNGLNAAANRLRLTVLNAGQRQTAGNRSDR
jgi:hypothetical protein